MSYVGTHPTGRRYYAASKRRGVALAFAIFTRRARQEWDPVEKVMHLREIPGEQWKQTSLIEDRPYPNELHRVNGAYVPLGRDMTPREKADQEVEWYREIVHHEAVVVELRPADGRGSVRP